jgi:hypothetical protein
LRWCEGDVGDVVFLEEEWLKGDEDLGDKEEA